MYWPGASCYEPSSHAELLGAVTEPVAGPSVLRVWLALPLQPGFGIWEILIFNSWCVLDWIKLPCRCSSRSLLVWFLIPHPVIWSKRCQTDSHLLLRPSCPPNLASNQQGFSTFTLKANAAPYKDVWCVYPISTQAPKPLCLYRASELNGSSFSFVNNMKHNNWLDIYGIPRQIPLATDGFMPFA